MNKKVSETICYYIATNRRNLKRRIDTRTRQINALSEAQAVDKRSYAVLDKLIRQVEGESET